MSDKNKYFWKKMLRNTPKCVRKVLIIRFNELGVNVSHRAVFIPQKFGSRARIFYFTFFPLWQKRKKENGEKKGREKTKKKTSERPRCALCCPFSNLPVSLVSKLLHLFSNVYSYSRGKTLEKLDMP